MDLETIELGGLRSADPLITTDALSTAINGLADKTEVWLTVDPSTGRVAATYDDGE